MTPAMPLPSDCSRIVALLGPSLDGALDTASTIAVDEHLASCGECREQHRFQQAMRGSVKKVVGASAHAPDDFRARLAARLSAESTEVSETIEDVPASLASTAIPVVAPEAAPERERSRSRLAAMSSLRSFAPWAAAAAVVLVLGTYQQHRSAVRRNSVDGPLGDFVAEHARPLPPETKEVQGLGTYVGVPIHPLYLKRMQSAKFVGGRVLPVQHERAAQLQYEVAGASGGRVSVFIYDPRKLQIDASDLAARQHGASEVRVGRANGYSVAVSERGGVGYAVTADMDPDLTADLAAELDQ